MSVRVRVMTDDDEIYESRWELGNWRSELAYKMFAGSLWEEFVSRCLYVFADCSNMQLQQHEQGQHLSILHQMCLCTYETFECNW